MRKTIAAIIVALVTLAPTGAGAAGSDSPTPYTLDSQGLTLPGDDTFPAHGHVNIRYLVDGVEKSKGIHFDPNNNQPGGKWIGRNFIPWAAFDTDLQCVTWVQVAGYNQHFGEGGQEPYCIQKPSTPPPSDSEERVRDTQVKCDERIVTWVKEKRDAIFDFDWTQNRWVQTDWSEWEQIDSGFRNERPDTCDEIPSVGSSTPMWVLGASLLLLGVGGMTLAAARRKS